MRFEKYHEEITRRINNVYIDNKKISNYQLYSIALEVIQNEYLTDAFLMHNKYGGFTKGDINRIKSAKNYYQATKAPMPGNDKEP